MVLVDTSVWIDHFRNGNNRLIELLNKNDVLCHPFIIGELACGNLKNRTYILNSLNSLPQSINIRHDEIMQFIENNNLMGQGIGYIDITLLISSILTGIPLWTFDKKLNQCASDLKINFK